ncbi:hypothetical protein AX17_000708 [Amanita inopinata Kibby_2008]|nr:hypothetical protein AX17_000708 [Amanita inopinata Kibby_2008]
MDSTFSASYKPRLSAFPTELLNEIAEYSSKAELLALCRASRRFNPVAGRLLYRVVSLSDPVQAIKCCSTILSRPLAALAVRRFSINCAVQDLFRNFFGLVADALRRTIYLEAMDISSCQPLLVLLRSTPFPHLAQCSVPYSTQLTPFLSGRSSIRDLIVQPPTRLDLLQVVTDVFPHIPLPNLNTFVGPSKVAQYVMPSSNVYHLTVFWDYDKPPSEVVPKFALSNRSIIVLDNIVVGWDPLLFTSIANALPKIVMLRIRNASPLTEDAEPFVEHVESLLLKFSCLINLGISLIQPMTCNVDDLDREHATVSRWGEKVPTLQVCTLLSGTRWSRFRPDAWFPDRSGPNAEIKIQWLFKAILALKFPLDMYADMADAQGRELVSRLRELRDRGVEYPVLVLGETSVITATGDIEFVDEEDSNDDEDSPDSDSDH